MSKLGIIAALPAEATCLQAGKYALNEAVEIQKDIFVCISGIGRENAVLSAEKLLHMDVNALISWGIAGAVNSKLHPGDLVIADEVIDEDSSFIPAKQWLDNIGAYLNKTSTSIYIGKMISTNDICSTRSEKRRVLENTGACATDMESAAIAAFARENAIDFMVLRAIADGADMTIPLTVIEHTDELGRPIALPFMSSCIKQPGQLIDLIKLGIVYKRALSTLKQIAPDLKKQHFLYNS